MFYIKYLAINFIFSSFILLSCTDQSTNITSNPINVDVRMEVQILDSTYHLYSRPFTKIYFTTYKLCNNNTITDYDQSDTTSCPHGWGVKLLNYTLNSEDEKIILGASCDTFNGPNYSEVIIDYAEAERRIDSSDHSNIVKTFAIYYK